MKIHKKNLFQMKNQYMTKKEKYFKNTHKFHKNSKTYLDIQNEFTPKLSLTCSLLLRPGCHGESSKRKVFLCSG